MLCWHVHHNSFPFLTFLIWKMKNRRYLENYFFSKIVLIIIVGSCLKHVSKFLKWTWAWSSNNNDLFYEVINICQNRKTKEKLSTLFYLQKFCVFFSLFETLYSHYGHFENWVYSIHWKLARAHTTTRKNATTLVSKWCRYDFTVKL